MNRDQMMLAVAMLVTDRALRDQLQGLVGDVWTSAIEECAKAAEAYNWTDNDDIQDPDAHQKALAQAIRGLLPQSNGVIK